MYFANTSRRMLLFAALPLGLSAACDVDVEAVGELETTSQATYSSIGGKGPLNGVEWQIDAPWRMEPIDVVGGKQYDPIPLTFTMHDASIQLHHPEIGINRISLGRFCGLYVMEIQPGEEEPALTGGPGGQRVTFIPPEQFYEIEASKEWLSDGLLPYPVENSHQVRRLWEGDSPEDLLRLDDWAEWNGTTYYTPVGGAPVGADLRIITVAQVSTGAVCTPPATIGPPGTVMSAGDLMHQLKRGRESRYPYATGPVDGGQSIFMGDFLRTHYAAAELPDFGNAWAYGDLHYHSQGTDNDGESGTSYRSALATMKAMGVDYAFATDHASDGEQLTGVATVFVDSIPEIPEWVPYLEEYIIDELEAAGVGLPMLFRDAYRDMSPERWTHLHGWLNAPEEFDGAGNLVDRGANAEVPYRDGSGRIPQMFLGGEVDAIPEASEEDASRGWFAYGNNLKYHWRKACTDLPDFVIDHFGTFPGVCEDHMDVAGGPDGRVSLRDIQGPFEPAFARQHLVYLPEDPTNADAFVTSESSNFGGASRHLYELINQMDAGDLGYAFLAHPVAAASGNGIGRLGPDVYPYSEAQLEVAFKSSRILGLQLWNENTRRRTASTPPDNPFIGKRFPFLHKVSVVVPDVDFPGHWRTMNWGNLDWRWGGRNEDHLYTSLFHGTTMWDMVNLWGITPERMTDAGLAVNTPRKFFMAGGSDAHGDMNYRRTGRLLGWLGANDSRIASPRNLTYVGDVREGNASGYPTLGQGQVVRGLKSGRFLVTDGPVLRIAIDRDGNDTVDEADTNMGEHTATIGKTKKIRVVVEWKSSVEFGLVEKVDLYLGVNAGDRKGLVYGGNGTCVDSIVPITDSTEREYCPMDNGYVRDDTGTLRIDVPASEGFYGRRVVEIDPTDFPLFEYRCETEVVVIDLDGGEYREVLIDRCNAGKVATPERAFVRAVASAYDSRSTLEDGGARMSRFAFTNPVWNRWYELVVSLPDVPEYEAPEDSVPDPTPPRPPRPTRPTFPTFPKYETRTR